jgi:hypothetical protein
MVKNEKCRLGFGQIFQTAFSQLSNIQHTVDIMGIDHIHLSNDHIPGAGIGSRFIAQYFFRKCFTHKNPPYLLIY